MGYRLGNNSTFRMGEKPYAPSCDENRDPILAILRPRLRRVRHLLEVGSGTGQHAVYFAPALPHVTWQTSDVAHHLPGIRWWLAEHPATNLPPPIALDVTADHWPQTEFDAVFSANTAHMIDEVAARALLVGVAGRLRCKGQLLWYGPFKMGGCFNGPNDRQFDLELRLRDPAIGLKDTVWLDQIAASAGLKRIEEIAMPANNFVLIWEKACRDVPPAG